MELMELLALKLKDDNTKKLKAKDEHNPLVKSCPAMTVCRPENYME